MSLEIIIGADVAPTAKRAEWSDASASNLLSADLKAVWDAADARIFNLKTPLIDDAAATQICGPAYSAPLSCAEGLAALSPTSVCLCNDHIMDYGEEGLLSTRAALKKKHVASFGAGEDLDEADQPFFFAKHGVRIGVYAVCEHAFSFATDRKAGANPLDLINIGDRVREIKSTCDRLIVLYYGGREGYPYPSPDVQKTCRKIADCGASLVICQSSHSVGSQEHWNNATLVYGQGDFLAESRGDAQSADTALLVRYTVGDYGADKVEFVPIVGKDGGAGLANEATAAEILEGFRKRSTRIRIEGFVPARYESYAAEQKDGLLRVFLGGSVLIRTLNMLNGRRPTRVYDRQTKINILHSLRCESVRELIIRGLQRDVLPAEH